MIEYAKRTTVYHVRDVDLSDPDVVYIGRAAPRQRIKSSVFGNPYKVTARCTRRDAIEFYRWVMKCRLEGSQAILWQHRVAELRGKKLACWCKGTGKPGEDVPCHGDVLAELADGVVMATIPGSDPT